MDAVPLIIQLVGERAAYKLFVQSVFEGSYLRGEFLNRVLVQGLRLFIITVNGNTNVAPGKGFTNHCIQFAFILDPLFKFFA